MKRVDSKLSKIVLLALMLSLSLATTDQSSIVAEKLKLAAQATVIPNTYIVTYGSGSLPSAFTSTVSSLKGKIASNLAGPGIAILTSDNPNFATEIAKVAGITSVVNDRQRTLVDPNWKDRVVRLSDLNPPFSNNQNDDFNLQWGLDAVNAPEAWKTGARGRGAIVAVLDTGFDLNHPDLKANIIKTYSSVPTEGPEWVGPDDDFSHGTHVAGIIAGVDNKVGIVGVAPEAKLILVKVMSDKLGGGLDSWVLAGMLYAIEQGADIINLSLGAFDYANSLAHLAYNQMAAYAKSKGTTIIAAQGNDAVDLDYLRYVGGINLPSEATNVISVTATGPIGWAKYSKRKNLDNIANYTNYGSSTEFAAPGGTFQYVPLEEITTLAGVRRPTWVFDMVYSSINGGYAWAAGTSMASPHVCGVAALIIGKVGKLSTDQLKEILIYSADDLGAPYQDVYYGYGRVNAYKAVMACGGRY